MKNQPLWQISVVTTPEAEDAVANLLEEFFKQPPSSSFNLETQATVVSAYFSKNKFPTRKIIEKISDGLSRIKNCGLEIGPGKISLSKIRREDWAESWKKHFRAIEIGGSLLVKPGWIKKRPGKNQVVVILDPGLSFGTGQHPTTKFCLEQIATASCSVGAGGHKSSRRLEAAKSFLDIGTGSGILAIAAAKLGFKTVHTIDFDSTAIKIAQANARANRVANKIKIARGDVTKSNSLPKEKFDLVCANLISNLLIAERQKIISRLKPNGVLVLAGILSSEFSEVQRAFENCGLKLISAKTEKEWRSGSFVFKK
ncbi:MAG TPA: 50S ribosomal protein L11 methyltransferase [Verrucomicrobiae bacterium]